MPFPLLIPLATTLAAEFAPDLVRWIAGEKAGDVAERIVGAAKAATGQDEGDGILAALRTDPKLALNFQMRLSQERLEMARIDAQDRGSARNLMSDLARAGSKLAVAPVVISTVVTVGFVTLLMLLLRNAVPAENREVIYLAVGSLAAGFVQVLNFWLGSSASSQSKTAIMERIIPKR